MCPSGRQTRHRCSSHTSEAHTGPPSRRPMAAAQLKLDWAVLLKELETLASPMNNKY